MRRLLIALIVVTAACGGGYDGPEAGYVRGHEYDDPDYHPPMWMPGTPPSCQTYNKTTTCSPGTPGYWIPERTDPARWFLVIDDGEKRGSFQVDQATYERVRDGQWFNTKTGEVEPR